MIQKINTPVHVTFTFDPRTRRVYPDVVYWNGRTYPITKVGFHHTKREGRTLYHVFSVVSTSTFFKLLLDTDTLHWKLEEIADDEAN